MQIPKRERVHVCKDEGEAVQAAEAGEGQSRAECEKPAGHREGRRRSDLAGTVRRQGRDTAGGWPGATQ